MYAKHGATKLARSGANVKTNFIVHNVNPRNHITFFDVVSDEVLFKSRIIANNVAGLQATYSEETRGEVEQALGRLVLTGMIIQPNFI